MNRRDVELFYNNYKKSIVDISRLEKSLLKESYSYEKWFDMMQAQSKTLRDLYAQNLKAYDEVIKYACDHSDELSEEVYSEFLVHVDFFISEGFRDYGVTVPVINAILPYWKKTGNKGKIMDCYFFLGVSLYNSHYYGESCNALSEALACFDDFMECPEPYWTYRQMCAVYYRLAAYVELNRYNSDLLYKYYLEAYEMWTDERVPDWMESAKKKNAIIPVIRTLVCVAINRMLDKGDIPSDELLGVLVQQFEYESGNPKACMGQVVYGKYLRQTGRMSPDDYLDMLQDVRRRVGEHFEMGFTYGLWEFTALFDDELADESFSEDLLFCTNPAYKYVYFVLTEILSIASSKELKDSISQEIYRYILEMPPLPGDGNIDSALYPIGTVLLSRCDNEELLVNCILNLLVHRQIMTAIHVTMVARLASCVTRNLVASHPEYFRGILDLTTDEEIKTNVDKIAEFAYKSSICHDIGKLTCTDVIRLQNRKILDEEFKRIQNHPTAGADALMNSKALSPYSLAALCHHIFDDGSRGYPVGVKLPDSATRIIIEIITVCDSIDAMSDNLGRNYANPKNMDTILKELSEQAGTRYSKRVVDELMSSKALIDELSVELNENRIQVNYDIYRRYVVPDTKFLPEDEKYITPLLEEEMEVIFENLGLNVETHRNVYSRCRNYSYVVKDGRGDVFGILMCELNGDSSLWIRQGFVKKEYRRQGIGNLLMNYLENVAHDESIDNIYAPELIKGHYDKFAWHNGYIKSQIEGWLVKRF